MDCFQNCLVGGTHPFERTQILQTHVQYLKALEYACGEILFSCSALMELFTREDVMSVKLMEEYKS